MTRVAVMGGGSFGTAMGMITTDAGGDAVARIQIQIAEPVRRLIGGRQAVSIYVPLPIEGRAEKRWSSARADHGCRRVEDGAEGQLEGLARLIGPVTRLGLGSEEGAT